MIRGVQMKFIAHRGYSHRYPENSLEAFKAVVDHPCNGSSLIGIELDVHLTADDTIPIMHEVTVRAEDGSMVPVAECTFERLQYLHRLQYENRCPRIPDFHSVLSLINHRTTLCIEIKTGQYDLDRFIGLFREALIDYRPAGDVIISSFSSEIIATVRSRLADLDLPYGFIFEGISAFTSLSRKTIGLFDYLHPWYPLLFTHRKMFEVTGLPVRCWTVNDLQLVKKISDLGTSLTIDAVMTDDITLAETIPDG